MARVTERQPKIKTHIRREQILQAALDVIAEEGVSELSMAVVARRVGLVTSGLYRHFRRKDEILEAVLGYIGDQLMSNVAEAGRAAGAVPARLRKLAEFHVAMIRRNQVILRIVFSDAIHGHRQAWRRKVHAILEGYLGGVAEMVRAGKHEGSIHAACDARAASVMFLGLVQPAAVLWHISGGSFDLEGYFREGWKVFARGIAA